MTWAIDLDSGGGSGYMTLATDISNTATQWKLEFRLQNNVTVANTFITLFQNRTNTNDILRLKWLGSPTTRDQIRLTIDAVNYQIDGAAVGSVMEDNDFHDHRLEADGVNLSWYIDNTLIGSVACTAAFKDMGRIGIASENAFAVGEIKYYETTAGDVLINHWSPDQSDRTNTGAQPILLDIIAENDATGVSLPTDGSAWVNESAVDIDTTPVNVRAGQTGLVLGASGGGFGATQGAGTVTYGGVSATVTAWSDTSITVSLPATLNLKVGNSYTFVVTDNAAIPSTSIGVPLLPPTGYTVRDLTNPVNTQGTLGEIYGGTAAGNGDQWVYQELTASESVGLEVDLEGYWILDSAPTATDTASFFRIDELGTEDSTDTITFVIGAAGGGGVIKRALGVTVDDSITGTLKDCLN